ncbi:MAG: alpha/beta hydrolase, partial [Oscillospiraceae bacterium]
VRKTSSRSERKKGDDFRNEKLYKTMLDAYTKKIPNAKTQFDWLSRDATVVDNYINDEKCNFVFTNSAFDDLSELLDQIYGKEWAQKVATNLPIFLLSGAEDPFGNYGKGIKKIHKLLVNSCVEDVEMKIYDGCRHDILNETNKKDIFKEILEWIEQRTKGFI